MAVMGRGGRPPSDVDESLATRVAMLSSASQRWLKTVLHTIRSAPVMTEESEPVRRAAAAERATPEPPRMRGASLEDVITGEADLRDQLAAYPELAEELDGLADIIDMLREAGDRRGKRGEQILREEILGETREPGDSEEPT